MEACPNPEPDCHLRECFGDTDHQYWPAHWYRRPYEREFRNLPENKRFVCRREHNERHANEEPPEKPSMQFMLDAIKRAKGWD